MHLECHRRLLLPVVYQVYHRRKSVLAPSFSSGNRYTARLGFFGSAMCGRFSGGFPCVFTPRRIKRANSRLVGTFGYFLGHCCSRARRTEPLALWHIGAGDAYALAVIPAYTAARRVTLNHLPESNLLIFRGRREGILALPVGETKTRYNRGNSAE